MQDKVIVKNIWRKLDQGESITPWELIILQASKPKRDSNDWHQVMQNAKEAYLSDNTISVTDFVSLIAELKDISFLEAAYILHDKNVFHTPCFKADFKNKSSSPNLHILIKHYKKDIECNDTLTDEASLRAELKNTTWERKEIRAHLYIKQLDNEYKLWASDITEADSNNLSIHEKRAQIVLKIIKDNDIDPMNLCHGDRAAIQNYCVRDPAFQETLKRTLNNGEPRGHAQATTLVKQVENAFKTTWNQLLDQGKVVSYQKRGNL